MIRGHLSAAAPPLDMYVHYTIETVKQATYFYAYVLFFSKFDTLILRRPNQKMYDYHTHSAFSEDCSTPMNEMLESACKLGIREIAVTDHFDPDYADVNFPFELDFAGYHKSLQQIQEKYGNRIKIVKGIEIGIQHGKTLDKCIKAARDFNYDFIIGSFHCAEGHELYGGSFFRGRSVERSYLAFYNYMYDNLLKYKDYDVLGHFNVIDRYTERIPSASGYMDIVEEILKLIIADGKGLEINTSSFRYGMGDRTTPANEILSLYGNLGGEIITIGSDAHRPRDLGHMFDHAVEMIRNAGIKYLTTFEQRKPKFISLDKI
jgi:histidinol-phosphatase (PHP family)